MPIKANIPGVGLVDFPDDVTDDELSSAAELLTKGRLQSAAATVAREPGRMAGGAVSGLARLGQLFGETMERQPMTFGPGGAIPSIATQTDEQLSKTLSRTPKTDAQMADELASDPLYQAGKNLTAGAEEAFPTNPLHADRFETAVASGVGSVLGLLPSALAGPAAPLVAGATYGLSQGEDMAQEAAATTDALVAKAKELGDTATAAQLERDKFQKQAAAFLAGASVGAATEGAVGLAGRLVPIVTGKSRMGARIAEKVGERPVVKGLIEGTVREGTQETTEQIAQNIAAGQIYDPERRALEGVGMAGGAGAVVGGLFGSGAGAIARRQAKLRPTPAEAKVAPESADALDQLVDELARAPVATAPTDEDAITPPLEVPAAAPPPAAPVAAGTAETPPTPESTETIAAQLAATFDPASTKSVTLVTPGEKAPPVPAGADVTETPHGVAISNPDKINPEAVAEAAAGPVFAPGPLGMGAAVAESDTAVTTSTPDGTEVVSELATPETIPAAVQAQQAAVPGGVTSVVPAADVISGRQSQAPATEEPKAPAAAPDSGQASPAAAGEPAAVVAPKRKRAKKEVQNAKGEVAQAGGAVAQQEQPVDTGTAGQVETGTPLGDSANRQDAAGQVATPEFEYDAAKAEFGKVSKEFAKAQKAYRTRTIGDSEFLAARKRFDDAQAAFDAAEARFIEAKNAPAVSTPAEAAADVKAQVQTVASTEGPRSAKEVKSELVSRLEEALKTAPERDPGANQGYVTIDIPGDGKFTIANNQDAIGDLLARAKRLATASTTPAPKIRTPVRSAVELLGDIETELRAAESVKGTKRDQAKIDALRAKSDWLAKQIESPSAPELERIEPSPKPKASKRPQTLTASEINRELDDLDKQSATLTDQMIAAGRGTELPTETFRKDDALSMRAKSIFERRSELHGEIAARYGPNAPSRLPPRGFGPREKPDKIDAALTSAIEATKLEPGAFEFTRAIPQAALNAILRAARVLYRAGRSLAEAIREAIRQHRIDNPADQFDDAEMEQAVTEAINSGQVIPPAAAPGTKTQMSEGLFTGPITKDTDRQWSEAAKEWVDQFGDDLQTAVEKATSPAVQMDAALRQYALTEIIARSNQQAERARNSVDTLKALRIQERAATALRDSGAQEFGKVGAARALAFKRIEGLMPVLAYRNLIRQAQDRLPFPEVASDNVRKWLKKAGSKAVAEVRASMRKADNVVARELKREVRDMGNTWREILTSSLDVQGDHRRALYARVFARPELQGISPAGATEIVNLLSDEWERQRMRIFRQEFRKEVPLPGVRESDLKKLEESLPAIVIQANLGMLDNETFRNAIAPKYGVATFDGATAEKVNKLAQAAQAAPAGVVRSRIIAQMMDAIRRSDTVQFKDIFRDYWFAAMLSGIRTQVDNGMSILNGVINTGMAMARNPGAAPLITSAYLRGFGEAAADFVPILKGERWRMHNVDIERPASALEALKQSQNPVARLFGNAAFVSRLIGALDHMNSLSTREAMKAWAMYRISPEDSKRALSVSKEDIDAARERAIQENTPKTLLNKRVREILEERIPVEAVLSATDMGRQVSFQNEPYGLLGHFYRFIQNASNMEGKGKAKGAEADRFRQTTGAFLRIISGTAFARYALNYTNDILNYVAPVGLYRWYQSSPANEGRSGLEFSPEFRELLITKSILGTLVATVAAAVFLGDDDDDERKRAIDITGSFRGLDSKKRNQLLSEGRQPYSIRIGDKYISYRQLPIAGVLGTVGEMRDRQLFDRAAFDQDSVAAKLANAGLAGALIVRDSSALVGLMDLLGFAQTYKYDTEGILQKSLPKFAARTLGSLIPNIAKELDAWTDPGLYRANAGWEYFMQQVPWVRREIPPGPAVDVFGDKISVERKPWSRWVKERKQDPEWIVLGDLASKGVFMPIPGPWKIENDDGTRRDPTPAEMQSYQKKVGAEYRTFIREQGADLLAMDPDEARQQINRETSAIRKSVRAELSE